MVMVLAFLVILCAPFMPYVYVHLEEFMVYLGKDYLTAIDLVEQMYNLHMEPYSISAFGFEHYGSITMFLVVLGILMIVLPMVLEAVSLACMIGGNRAGVRKLGVFLAVLSAVLFIVYFLFFAFAGFHWGIEAKPGYGVYAGLAASISFSVAAFLERKPSRAPRGGGTGETPRW